MPKKRCDELKDKFRSLDELSPSILTELHLNQDMVQKNYCGAFVTLSIQVFFIAFVIHNFLAMVNRENVYLTSIDKTIQIETEVDPIEFPLRNFTTMFFVVKDFTNMHIPIEELNKYATIEVQSSSYNYDDNGKEIYSKQVSELVSCTREHFSKNAFELSYFDDQVQREKDNGDSTRFRPLCFKLEDLDNFKLFGYHKSRNVKQKNSVLSVKIYQCDHEDATAEQKAKCATDTDKWLYDKIFEPYIFQEKVEFDNYVQPIQGTLQRQTGFKLDTKEKSIIWARMRQNILYRFDHFMQPYVIVDEFWKFIAESRFNFNVPEDKIGSTYIGGIIFRVDQQLVEHTRSVPLLINFVEIIAGMHGLLFTVGAILFGSMSKFKAEVNLIREFYHFRNVSSNAGSIVHSDKLQNFKEAINFAKFDICNYILFFLKHETPLGICFACCKPSKDRYNFEQIILKGREQLESDFDFKVLINFFHEQNGNLKLSQADSDEKYIPVEAEFRMDDDDVCEDRPSQQDGGVNQKQVNFQPGTNDPESKAPPIIRSDDLNPDEYSAKTVTPQKTANQVVPSQNANKVAATDHPSVMSPSGPDSFMVDPANFTSEQKLLPEDDKQDQEKSDFHLPSIPNKEGQPGEDLQN